jgi:apolipoprotein D and lipocalin family protein
MKSALMSAIVVFGCAAFIASAAAADAPRAHEPARPVEATSFWAGRWYEIGRTPKSFNKDCVAGVTDFQMKDGGLYEQDACHDKTPDGKEETIGGAMKILNPGPNTKVDVAYHALFGFVPIHVENWALDHAEGWAILGTPDMSEVHLYTREPHPSPELVEKMTKEVRDLGYAGELQLPPQSRP